MKVPLKDAEELAREVLSRVQDCDIRFAQQTCRSSAPQPGMLRTETALALQAGMVQHGLLCASAYDVSAHLDSGEHEHEPAEGDTEVWNAAVEVHGQWLLSTVEGLTPEHAQAFALAVGSMALHPYARSQIQMLVVSAGYPVFTLDVLQSLLEPGEDGLVDLGVVATPQAH